MIELLAPAGDLEKLKIAVIYGADAVFIGGTEFSLRSRASNFTLDDIKEGCKFAHEHGVKIHVTTNIIPHNENLEGIKEYLLALEKSGVDAVISASLHIIKMALEYTKMEVHVSTQQSITNNEAVNFYADLGVHRVVLGREVTLIEMQEIREKTKIDLEVFIHGGMCSSYSGRCMLSNEMALRDANRGGCAHSCRWNYDLYLEKEKINKNDYFSLASKDLCAMKFIPKLIDMGITSLKIEGRMKSIHYIATIVNAYRRAIDSYNENGKIDEDFLMKVIRKAENRLTSVGFYDGIPTPNEQLYINFGETSTQEFIGIVQDYDGKNIYVEERNYFEIGDKIEVFSPNKDARYFILKEMFDQDGNPLDVARHPHQIVKIPCEFQVEKYDILRKC